jgi:hypothetical protein
MSISIRDIAIPIVVITSTTLAALAFSKIPAAHIHNRAGLAVEGYGAFVIGPNGNFIGAGPNPSIRSQMQKGGLPE